MELEVGKHFDRAAKVIAGLGRWHERAVVAWWIIYTVDMYQRKHVSVERMNDRVWIGLGDAMFGIRM